jgi:hypothetical protein
MVINDEDTDHRGHLLRGVDVAHPRIQNREPVDDPHFVGPICGN